MPSISLKSYAKINLTLKILGMRPDGFHNIESIMQTVSLFDEVKCIETPGNSIEISCSDKKVPVGEKNICYKAAELVKKKLSIGKGVGIDIKKSIPMEAGMGGGSSNAAAVLVGLNKMWELKLSEDELVEIAAEIGSDVPFFIIGGRCLCKGRGEIIEKIGADGRLPLQYIIVKPDVSVPTVWAYKEWDRTQSTERRTQNTGNDLEAVVINKYPVIGEIKKSLLGAGCTSSQMTGSGSAVFGVCRDEDQGKKVLIKIKERYPRSFFVQDAGKGIDLI